MTDHDVRTPREVIGQKILLIWRRKVILDSDLAGLYGVVTKRLSEQVGCNPKRSPADFMFQLTKEEYGILRSKNATSSRGGRRYLPYAFTEQRVAVLSSVLDSDRAIIVNVEIMRTFVRLREIFATHKDLARKLEMLEKEYDEQFAVVSDAIRELMTPPEPPTKRRIGFGVEESKTSCSAKKK